MNRSQKHTDLLIMKTLSQNRLKKIIKTFVKTNSKKTKRPLQPKSKGEGPIYHRQYSIEIKNFKIHPKEVMKKLKLDINRFCPPLFVRFEKIKGLKKKFKVGDEFLAKLIGPWNSPTRVVKSNTLGFKMATIEGSMEAGHVQMYIFQKGKKWYFEVESLARSRDGLISFLYDHTPFLKLGQAGMWAFVCEKFNGYCQGDINKVKIFTKKENKINSF